eukprot:gnl/TRDRNA2_/TRDRNA2_64971_c0_seq1.p1 gnl/TRDRNA2_/TRDRNA2_64971_c0~~gnl/TRDRNA2_/TRDRNA2_64971_c0_seq1.p1  ORF type:complete len:196 (+),score=31.04 gnl/TRDRNA2_/TRDRNA2_64971_c0_seq1:102-689(+)
MAEPATYGRSSRDGEYKVSLHVARRSGKRKHARHAAVLCEEEPDPEPSEEAVAFEASDENVEDDMEEISEGGLLLDEDATDSDLDPEDDHTRSLISNNAHSTSRRLQNWQRRLNMQVFGASGLRELNSFAEQRMRFGPQELPRALTEYSPRSYKECLVVASLCLIQAAVVVAFVFLLIHKGKKIASTVPASGIAS